MQDGVLEADENHLISCIKINVGSRRPFLPPTPWVLNSAPLPWGSVTRDGFPMLFSCHFSPVHTFLRDQSS